MAIAGALFTRVYNEKQDARNAALKEQEIRIAQIQTVEKFIPHLTGTEDQKKIAILAVFLGQYRVGHPAGCVASSKQ